MRPLRLCRIVTVPITFATLLYQQIGCIANAGIDLTVVSSPGEELIQLGHAFPVRCCAIPIARKLTPARDLISLIALTRFLLREQFDVVHSSTPKAGLLTALAGRMARIPIRIHTYTGQPWVELHGSTRWLVRESDRLIGLLNTCTYADSASQRDFLIAEGLVTSRRISVLGAGSISGVDLRRFNPGALAGARSDIRCQLGIAPQALVIVFVGRVIKDKGVIELTTAFRTLSQKWNDIHLLLVGPQEPERDPLPPETLAEFSTNAQIHCVGFASRPEKYLAAADIFCLPSYREGFGSVIIEAGAMSLPSVATRVTGVVDAVVEGETGLLVPAKDALALAHALQRLAESPEMRRRMGPAARRRAIQQFDAEQVNQAVVDEYLRLAQAA